MSADSLLRSLHRPDVVRGTRLEQETLLLYIGTVAVAKVAILLDGKPAHDPLFLRIFVVVFGALLAVRKSRILFLLPETCNRICALGGLISLHSLYLMSRNGISSVAGQIAAITLIVVITHLREISAVFQTALLCSLLSLTVGMDSFSVVSLIAGLTCIKFVLQRQLSYQSITDREKLHARLERVDRLVKELESSRLRAEQSSQFKSQFLSRISHEIRTPLSGILGMTSLAMDTDLNVTQREYLEAVKFSSDTLLSLVNDILDISKIEAGEMKLESIAFPLRDLLRKTMRGLWFRIAQKGLRFDCRTEPDIEDILLGDPTRLKQILTNLVSNALKFTEQGGIMVRVKRGDGQLLHFSVQDTGVGIDASAQDRLFKPFSQADDSTTRKYGGTGLGLSICRELVQMMHGKIWVESSIGCGSTFHFTVLLPPVTEQAAQASFPHSPPPTFSLGGRRSSFLIGDRRLRVLLAEDDLINQRVTQLMLEKAGHDVVVVDNGLQAVQAVLATLPYQRLIPMLQRGVLKDSGRTTIPQAMQYSLTRSRCNSMASSRGSVVSGMDAADTAAPTSPKMSPAATSASMHDVEPPFDIVLMDILMPEMDGLEATRSLREWEQYAHEIAGARLHIPIMALTAYNMTGDRERCLAAGMDDFLGKPLEQVRLVEAVQRVQMYVFENHSGRSGGSSPAASHTSLPNSDIGTRYDPTMRAPSSPHATSSPKSVPSQDASQRWRINQEHRKSVPDSPTSIGILRASMQRRHSACEPLFRSAESGSDTQVNTLLSVSNTRTTGLPPVSPAALGRRSNSYVWSPIPPAHGLTQPLPARHANSPDLRGRFHTPSPLRGDIAAWMSSPARSGRRNTSTSSSPFGSRSSAYTVPVGATIHSTPSSPALKPLSSESPFMLQSRQPSAAGSTLADGSRPVSRPPIRHRAHSDTENTTELSRPRIAGSSAFDVASRLAAQRKRVPPCNSESNRPATVDGSHGEQPGEQPKAEEHIFDSAWYKTEQQEWPTLHGSPYPRMAQSALQLPVSSLRWRAMQRSPITIAHSADEAAAGALFPDPPAADCGDAREEQMPVNIAFPACCVVQPAERDASLAKDVESVHDDSASEVGDDGGVEDVLSRLSSPSPVASPNTPSRHQTPLIPSQQTPVSPLGAALQLLTSGESGSHAVSTPSPVSSPQTPLSQPMTTSIASSAPGQTPPSSQQPAPLPSPQQPLPQHVRPRVPQAVTQTQRRTSPGGPATMVDMSELSDILDNKRPSVTSWHAPIPQSPRLQQLQSQTRSQPRPPRPLLHAASEGNLFRLNKKQQASLAERARQLPKARPSALSPVPPPGSPVGETVSVASSIHSHVKRRSSFVSADSMQYSTGSDVEPLSRLTSPPRRAAGDVKPATVLSVLQSGLVNSPPRSSSSASPSAAYLASPASARSSTAGSTRATPRSPTLSAFVPLTPPRSPSFQMSRRPVSGDSLDDINLVVPPHVHTSLSSGSHTAPDSPLMTPPVLTFATSDREQSVFTPQDISTALAALPLPALTPPLGLSEPSPGTPNSENFERQDSPLLALPVPARRSHSMLLTMPHASDLGCKRVLIVDDNTVNQSVLRAMVMKIGVPAEVAGDGEVALRMCVQSQFRYGLILMDSHMPRLSGIECTRLLRETEQRDGHARQPVVLFTADDCRGSRCAPADFDGCLHKPYMRKDVRRLLVKFGVLQDSSAQHSSLDD